VRFQEELPYGVRPKTTFFDNLCYHGPWSTWKLKSYSQRLNAHRCSILGMPPPESAHGVLRLPDHTSDVNATLDSVYRYRLRKAGVQTLVMSAWRRSLAARGLSTLYFNRTRLALLRHRSEYSEWIVTLTKHADKLLRLPVLPPADRLYVSSPGGGHARDLLQYMFDNVTVLTLAGAVTGRRAYSAHAVAWVRAWFLDNGTRLTPTLRGSQTRMAEPALNLNSTANAPEMARFKKGPHRFMDPNGLAREATGTGCMEFRALYYVLDAIQLLADSKDLRHSDYERVRVWAQKVLHTMTRERYGRLERQRNDSYGIFIRLTLIALSNFVGETEILVKTLYELNPLLTRQTVNVNHSTPDVFHLERREVDCRHHVAFTSHAWTLALLFARRLGARLDETAVCRAIYVSLIVGGICENQSTPVHPQMAEREHMVANSWRSICATSVNVRRRPDVAGASLPRLMGREFSVAPYWNLVSPV